jgi:hypothetical protein
VQVSQLARRQPLYPSGKSQSESTSSLARVASLPTFRGPRVSRRLSLRPPLLELPFAETRGLHFAISTASASLA